MSSEIAVLLQKNQTTQGKLAEVQEQCKDAEVRVFQLSLFYYISHATESQP